jgi:hypothetical protein
VQEIRDQGPKTLFFECFHFIYHGSRSHQRPLPADQKRWKGLAHRLFRPMYA